MDRKEILIRNYKGELDTFIGELHERDRIDKKSYKEYLNSIKNIISETYNQRQLDRKLTYIIFFTYNYFFKRAYWNSSESDLSKIINATDEEITEYIEELSSIMEKYIIGKF